MLADAIAQALPGLRAEAESLMTATCTIRDSETGEPTTDADTGKVTPAVGDVVYSGPCRVRPTGAEATTADAGAVEVFTFDYLVSVPFFVTAVMEGHRLTIDDSPDPALVDVELKIERVARGEHITARRLFCREVA